MRRQLQLVYMKRYSNISFDAKSSSSRFSFLHIYAWEWFDFGWMTSGQELGGLHRLIEKLSSLDLVIRSSSERVRILVHLHFLHLLIFLSSCSIPIFEFALYYLNALSSTSLLSLVYFLLFSLVGFFVVRSYLTNWSLLASVYRWILR